MDSTTLIRSLDREDATLLMSFYNDLGPSTKRLFHPLGSRTSLDVCEMICRENAASPAARIDLIAGNRNAIVGWVFLNNLNKNHPDLGIAVADAVQGRGVGTAMMQEILVWASEHGLREVFLMVVQDNERAVRFYERHGFVTYDREFDEIDRLPYFHMVRRA